MRIGFLNEMVVFCGTYSIRARKTVSVFDGWAGGYTNTRTFYTRFYFELFVDYARIIYQSHENSITNTNTQIFLGKTVILRKKRLKTSHALSTMS